MGEGRGVYRVLVGKPEGKRPLWRPRRIWPVNIKMDHQEVESLESTRLIYKIYFITVGPCVSLLRDTSCVLLRTKQALLLMQIYSLNVKE